MAAEAPKAERHIFFKVIFSEDFSTRLRLPPNFTQNRARSLTGKARLKISGGHTWDVELEKMDDGTIWFCKAGWAQFVEDAKLELFDFLRFKWYAGTKTFKVDGCGRDGCQKEIFSRVAGADVAPVVMKSFTTELKKHHYYYMTIPKAFASETGIEKGKIVKLENERGVRWRVKVYEREERYKRICFMDGAWKSFWKRNELFVGAKVTFTYDASSGIFYVKKGN
ncbi:Unknown protein [Striga hermonthica]|uniref:TF-B3 domain-containing protein n=1 Tax=Striga hermonthica TaxID=68872 RepID=A0A9N7NYF4_STRHE|nr:Unknown protein [Striga hermonthica]